jgi:predicted ATPase
MFELGARPHPPRSLYRAYLEQSQVFVGIYWQRYGWVAPGEEVSGLEDEYRLAGDRPKLIYIKTPAPDREPGLRALLDRIRSDDHASYKSFSSTSELRALIENDLAVLLSERFLVGAQTSPAAPRQTRRSTNIPAPTSSFVGREVEVAAIVELLRGSQARLVTLTGPGGVGKTRLSLEVVRTIARAFGGGVHVVSLANVSDPDLVISAIAQQLGATQQDATSPMDRVRQRLSGRRTLLVLDNFEQVVGAAPGIAELLAENPRLALLVTSRTPLQIRGEMEFDVRPLPVPPARGELALEAPAVQLFLERARAIRPDIGNQPSDVETIAEICRRLDGLPLAIELAAARTRILSPEAILDRLSNTLGLLTHGAPDLPDRQRTLRATLDWSFDLLNEIERTLFTRLGVFAGGWTLEAAEAVCKSGTDIVDVLDTLMFLIDRSLVQRGPDGRFRMLSVVREYAQERLAMRPERAAVEAAFAKYVLEFVQVAASQLRGAGQQTWRALLAAEQDNVRAAMRWMLDSGELGAASKLQVALIVYWWIQGYATEARRWSDELLAHVDSLDLASTARANLAGGVACAWEGATASGIPLLEHAIAQFHEVGDSLGAGVAEMALAYALPAASEYVRKQTLLLESAADLYQAGDLWAVNVALQSRADVALASGHVVDAGELYADGLELARQQTDIRGTAQAQVGLGFVALQTNDVTRAEQFFDSTVQVGLELGNPELLGHALRGLAGVAHTRAQQRRAAMLLGAARSLVDESGSVDWPAARQLRTQLEVEVQRCLGPARFAAAFEEGRGLSMSAAAQFATLASSTGTRRCGDAKLRARHPPAVSRQRRRRDEVRV